MQRGRTPQAHVELASVQCVTAEQEFQSRSTIKQDVAARREAGEILFYGRGIPERDQLEAPKRDFDECEFKLAVVNAGELIMRDFALTVRILDRDGQAVFVGEQSPTIGFESRFRFLRASE